MAAPTTPRDVSEALTQSNGSRQPQSLIISMFALYGRNPLSAIPVSAIIRLMADVGVDDAAVRSALMRLKRGNILQSVRERAAAYRLNAELEDVFREGDERIFAPKRSHPDDLWVLVSFSVPESQRNLRHRIRRILSQRGFGTVNAGLWIAPALSVDHLRQELQREQLLDFAEFFVGRPMEDSGTEKITTWWDIPALERMYAGFVERFSAVHRRWLDNCVADDNQPQAFGDYLNTVTAWRRLPFLDPGIPLEFLPEQWQGRSAEDLFAGIHRLLARASKEHVQSVIADS